MPFPGVPQKYWVRLDRCIEKVMTSEDFKRRYASRIKKIGAKSLAVAICRKALKV